MIEHKTVLLNELVDAMDLKPGDIAVDCTAGYGGHTELCLQKVGAQGKVIAFDRDLQAIKFLENKFNDQIKNNNLILINQKFSALENGISQLNLRNKIKGICADLGVSTHQILSAQRGFSFLNDGPLDMRMDQNSSEQSAADMINNYEFTDLYRIIKDLGEEPKAKFIVQAIIEQRKKKAITTTHELATIIRNSVHYNTKSKKNPATKTFMALRIAVNSELDELKSLLYQSMNVLQPNGRLAVISFHSLEDRIVKKEFVALTGKPELQKIDRHVPLTHEQIKDKIPEYAKIIKPFPIYPSENELNENPRSRSAKLRVLERV